MTKERAIEILQQRLDLAEKNGNGVGEYYDVLRIAIEAIKQTMWIPVTERLPKLPMCSAVEMDGVTHYFSDTVLVMTAYGVIDMGFLEADENEEFGWDVSGFRVEVTAWMPLPEPWEVDE